ncbi:unnamed protein product [Rotaria magnacalcarata]
MFIGASAYFFYVLSFLSPMIWSFYLTSVLLGVGAAILWTAEGAYLAANSDEHTTSRNTGVFWALFQCSLLGGNLYVYLSLKADAITRTTRYPLFFVFSVVCAIGLVIYACIIWRWLIERRGQKLQSDPIEQKTALSDVIETFKIALRLLKTRNMLLLLIPFAYTGFSQTFFQTVYATCIGHTIKYGTTRKRLIGLHGVLVEKLLGGGLFGFITKPKTSSQCALVILIGFFLQSIFYYSAWINFPADAPANETNAESYFQFSSSTSQVIAFVGSFIVGLGDSALNTQLFTVLASQFKHSSASAFALFQLVQGIASAIAYSYAGSLDLQYQLITVAGTAAVGNSSRELALPHGIFFHRKSNTLYVADLGNTRVQIFSLNQPSTGGTTAVFKVVEPNKIYVDDDDDNTEPTIYIAVFVGNRVEKWTKGATHGVQIGDECRSCSGISVDREKNVYMSESDRHRVLKWSPRTNTTIIVAGKTDDRGSSSEQLSNPEAIYIDQSSGIFYVADSHNNRIQKLTKDSLDAVTVAGSKTDSPGTDVGSLADPTGVWVDEETKVVYVADTLNNRVERWLPDASKGDTIAGGFGLGDAENQFNTPNDLTFDSEGNLYVSDTWNHRIQRFHIIDNHPCTPTSTVRPEAQICQDASPYDSCSTNEACSCLPLMNTNNDEWSKTGCMNHTRRSHTTSVLINEKVLVAGGFDNGAISNAELYDPSTEIWTTIDSMNDARGEHTASILMNGKVLITGGLATRGFLNSSELYDPSTETWTTTGSMTNARGEHITSVLTDGKVLVTGGYGDSHWLNSAELYDPSTETWTTTGSMNNTRSEHTSSVLANGNVLVTGGHVSIDSLASAEVYDPSTETWTATSSMNSARSEHTASVLMNGKVLVAGGSNYSHSLNSAELYDPSTQTWTITGSMNHARWKHTASVLRNGKVLVTGGFDHNALNSAELYDPSTELWTTIGSMNDARGEHTASVLTNGKMLVTGGSNGGMALNSAELHKLITLDDRHH